MARSHACIGVEAAVRLLSPTDPAWPRGLSDLRPADRPAQLCVAGEIPLLEEAIAVVGTRAADEDALAFAHSLAVAIAGAGQAVVSGGAAGVDAAAHRGCLEAGGRTVAVLATGLAHAYPAEHASLFRAAAAAGALVSEAFEPARIGRSSFLHRNRLIAALAQTLVIVQAPLRSGALSTARWALGLGRRVFVVPAAPWDVRGQGCLSLLRSGAQICTSPADVLSVAAPRFAHASRTEPGRSKNSNDIQELSACAQSIWRLLRRGPRYPDELSVRLDMPAARVQEGLLTLQLVGRARRRADGRYENTRSR